ncbi:hypothetical protein PTTG_09620 [Puccinia triticina 1-1 BBBD Race 1]|uniref:FAD-binding PCMH-type domain-containing protein n=2 Tax=Puccinia triticina TaxID=208348 RepID=A0A180H5A4_PUCT1|nr:uncharacterized protein PtA15_2A392 [Puccinia triticina]OAV99593.1 hypothetical protein PTTG_09620 [Puccinia triticina 1-1 BBBD Race 1]WAQ82079.1 hypothetical protein PtA15_2A392 [Puccinia triticina]WAR52942.1 hypothetical protein PtB15_2B370 [Puccinia triticina]
MRLIIGGIPWYLLVCLHGSYVAADTASLRQKLAALRIDAVFPQDPDYEKVSAAYNKRFTYKPAAIVFPHNATEVANAVKVGVAEKIPVSPRSGGHSYAAYGLAGKNGALVIDLERLKHISVDKASGQALIGAGSRLGDIALGLNDHGGRAIPHGTCPHVGLGGHAAFGGYGFSSRMWGLTLDQITEHEIVLANGTIVTSSATVNPDLFWALRGAGSSFGIMTAMRFRTQPAPSQATNFVYEWTLDVGEFSNALIQLQIFCMSELPAQLGLESNLGKGEGGSGKLYLDLTGVWYGAENVLANVIRPFLSQMPTPAKKSVKTTSWIASLKGTADGQPLSTSGVDLRKEHDMFYAKSLTTPQSTPMSNSSILAFSKYLANQGHKSNTDWFVQFELYGGKNSAVTAVGEDETAFAQRSILFTIQFYASSKNASLPYPAEGFTLLDNMVDIIVNNNPSGWSYGAYANYVDDRLSSSQWKSQYYKKHYQRLTQIKRAYDPRNVFSLPQSITE